MNAMRTKTLIVIVACLAVLAPGVLAYTTTTVGQFGTLKRSVLFSDETAVHYGHTTYVALFAHSGGTTSAVNYAAVASVSVARSEIGDTFFRGGVLWFNDSILFPDIGSPTATVTYQCMNNTAVHVVRMGEPDPRSRPASAFSYSESYRVTDPNGETYITDVYSVTKSGGGTFRDFVVDTGDCIQDPTLDDCSAHPPDGEGGSMDDVPCSEGFAGHYNALTVLKLSLVTPIHGNVTHPAAGVPAGDGESHHHNTTGTVPTHTHPMVKVDLYWGVRPPPPAFRTFTVNDLNANDGIHMH
ncbi:MAG: hypothetical protein ACT4PT_02290 [Methanobacteriota archaeon]